MCSALDSHDLHHLLLLALNGIGRGGLCQLTLISQGHNLCPNHGGTQFSVVVVIVII
jgi:hypothetical protein